MRATDDDDNVSDGSLSSSGGGSSNDGIEQIKKTAERVSGLDVPTVQQDGLLPVPAEANLSAPAGLEIGLDAEIDGDGLRLLTRSPHPYHHRNTDLLHAADRIASLAHPPTSSTTQPRTRPSPLNLPHSTTPIPTSTSAMSLSSITSGFFSKDSGPGSDSGTEADDEHFLKGLPAPRSKPHKGLRGMNEVLSGISTPLRPILSPARSDGENDRSARNRRRDGNAGSDGESLAGSVLSLEAHGEGDGNETRSTQGQPDHSRRQQNRQSTGSTAISPQALFHKLKGDVAASMDSRDKDRRQGRSGAEHSRRQREIVRRSTEVLLLLTMAALIFSKPVVRPLLGHWRHELQALGAFTAVMLLYRPYYMASHLSDGSENTDIKSVFMAFLRLPIPASFDPAPFLYPFALPILVSFLLARPTSHAAPLLNMTLSLCTLPRILFTNVRSVTGKLLDTQWLITCMPMYIGVYDVTSYKVHALQNLFPRGPSSASTPILILEMSTLLYPLHQTLCNVLHELTTTSLLPAELQLLSVALINLLVLARSPQAIILQALLWIGGVGLILLGGHAVRWGITLARIPRWRFRRTEAGTQTKSTSPWMFLSPNFLLSRVWAELKSLRRARLEMMYGSGGDRAYSDDSAGDSNSPENPSGGGSDVKNWRRQRRARAHSAAAALTSNPNTTGLLDSDPDLALKTGTSPIKSSKLRGQPRVTHTPSGRKKRATSPTVRAFFSLTHEQAVRRKWLYAGYLYACIALLILAGIRPYVATYALGGRDPFGWALGYLFGDVDWFRLEVVKANLERWVCLPPRTANEQSLFSAISSVSPPLDEFCPSCTAGWVEHIRQTWFGAATTRLLLVGYWVVVLVFGLAVVFTLSPVYEVDTRRKVFHFMMVAMLLPATFIDPAYVALALSLVLAVFLLLDLLRASQLPPLSRPIATFLTPYVDGRDLRGPVVISHIFLLIGCAIPLWLSLAALPRWPLTRLVNVQSEAARCMIAWELPSRDVSMVAGVICVGLGDAAASLIGRRWGRRKWLWGGGKSLEGSAAFALAVFLGLMLASLWLRVGDWPVVGQEDTPWAVYMDPPPPRSWAFLTPLVAPLPPALQRSLTWIGTKAAQSVAPRAALCASMASLTEAVLTGGNDNVIVPVILWTCVKSVDL
ncbi:dolichol kinase [Sporothrix eucalyptigena]